MVSDTTGIPEIGQIDSVRQRRFVVSDVIHSQIPQDVLSAQATRQNTLIALNSIEDDNIGETLQVIWELEPGASILETVGLPKPTGFDTPKRFDAFLNAVRWGAISSADMKTLQAPFRSGITIEDYQLDPLVRAVQMPRVNLLIADDVGMGKTIESGLVLQELIIRNRARNALIVCPSSLQIQWRDQMREKFGIEFRIVDTELVKELRRTRGLHTNPWSHYPFLITSIDYLKRDRPMRLMKEILPRDDEAKYPRHFDILIVDEAHNVAPVGKGKYATDSMRTLAIRALTPHFEHKIFLTATPHNGYKESFTALLELLDNQRFARGIEPDRQQLQLVMVRRMKSELLSDFDGRPRFPKRQIEAIEVAYTAEEKQVHQWLREYTKLRQSDPKDATERVAMEFVLKLLKKRLFSSPAAFLTTLEQHKQTLNNLKETKTRSTVALGILKAQLDAAEDLDDDENEDTQATEDALTNATRIFRQLTPQESNLLDQMIKWASSAARRHDSKTKQLIDWLKQTVKPNGVWSNERVVIFTEYVATLNWLQGLLASEGFTGDNRLQTLYGGLDNEKRESIKAAFQASPDVSPVRILLATDAASEGIDLQNFCHRIVHMEIPWNPNRLEQRNGRLDRHGQTKDVLVHHFVAQGFKHAEHQGWDERGEGLDADLEFLFRAAKKVEQIREDLGRVGPVIADQVQEAMLGKRSRLDTSKAESENQTARKMLRFERDLREQIAKQMEQLRQTKLNLNLSAENVYTIVETALELDNQPSLIPTKVTANVDTGTVPVAYSMPPLTNSWSVCSQGIPHPHTGVIRPIVFDHNYKSNRDDIVLCHLHHPLVSKSLQLLRAEVWSPAHRSGLHRLTVKVLPDNTIAEPSLIGFARLVVIGGDQNRLHEEIISAGGSLEQGKFNRLNIGQQTSLLETKPIANQVAPELKQRMLDLYPKVSSSLLTALEARSREKMEGLRKNLVERAQTESDNIEKVLNELANAIRNELSGPEENYQYEFSFDEEQQYKKNLDALRRRLAVIPDEIQAEKNLIQRRYDNIQFRLFPVCVEFLVPANHTR